MRRTEREREREQEKIANKGVKRKYKRPTFEASGLALSLKPTKCQTATEWRERKGKIVERTKGVLCPS